MLGLNSSIYLANDRLIGLLLGIISKSCLKLMEVEIYENRVPFMHFFVLSCLAVPQMKRLRCIAIFSSLVVETHLDYYNVVGEIPFEMAT